MKKFLLVILSVLMLMSTACTAFSAVSDTGFSDVSADAWYSQAVQYVTENNIMNGTGTETFSPDVNTDRGTLAMALYQASGRPEVSQDITFTDVDSSADYANSAKWAAANGVISGYDNGRFGAEDSITREQIAAILWRYSGRPSVSSDEDFADENNISEYASLAVDWARETGIINGKGNNMFDPQGNATRAEAAMILFNFMKTKQLDVSDDNSSDNNSNNSSSNILVVYYSATGSTKAVAENIANTLNADTFEIVPKAPYTSADLNWTDSNSRVSREHETEELRTVELSADTVDNWEKYDTVFIGYPIWWGIAAWPVDGFVKANDFTGKTVIPFCTSASSGLGESGNILENMAGTGNWQEGQRFRSGVIEDDITQWANGLGINN